MPPGALIGRSVETTALLSGTQRLITLVGPPGTGKTRLALHAARTLADDPAAPKIAWVALAQARTLGDVARLCLAALEVPAPPIELDAATAALDRVLEREPTLLVLDNFEQLVGADGALEWVGERLAAIEGLRLWITSRERLRIGGERAFEVPPLGTPEVPSARDSLLPPDPHAASTILSSDAVRLLLSRVPDLDASAHVDALAEIARSLEGIPLALELAAARLTVMAPAELAERLRAHGIARLDLLGRGSRDATERQATLRGAIDWSWALLSPEERDLLASLSLLRGAFAAELAAEIATIATGEPEGPTLERIQSLREKSLLAAPTTGRLALLESVRAFAEEKLVRGEDAGETSPDAASRRRAALEAVIGVMARRGAALAAELSQKTSRAAFEKLDGLREHLVRALELAETERAHITVTDASIAELALALDAVRVRVGLGRDLERVLRDLLAPGTDLSEPMLARISRALSRVLRDRGQLNDAVMVLERAVARAARFPVTSNAELSMLVEVGELLLSQGRFDEARDPIEDAVRSAEQRDERAIVQRGHATLGLLAHGQGRLSDAERHYTRALDDAQRLGDLRAEAHALRDLGNLALQRGEGAQARAYYEDALTKSPGGDLRLEGVVRGNLAILHQEEGHLDHAYTELRRALSCLRAVGDRPFEAHLLGYLGAIQHERGQLDAARDAYGKALTVLREVRDLRLEGVFSAARASVLAQKGHIGHAKNDLATAQRRMDEIGDPALMVALDLHRAAVKVSEAMSGGDVRAALTDATAVLERTATAAKTNDDARFAARMLRRLFPADALVIGAGGAWFELRGERTDLSGRPTLARMLDALAEARMSRPGQPLSAGDLLAAGWPGERVLAQAGQNRVRVGLTSLRNLGLRSAILTGEGGHLLDPALPISRR